jgi:ATP-binding protein involved in chromosome partitioning
MITSEQVYQALQGVLDPELKRNLVELGMVRDVEVGDSRVRLTLALPSRARQNISTMCATLWP